MTCRRTFNVALQSKHGSRHGSQPSTRICSAQHLSQSIEQRLRNIEVEYDAVDCKKMAAVLVAVVQHFSFCCRFPGADEAFVWLFSVGAGCLHFARACLHGLSSPINVPFDSLLQVQMKIHILLPGVQSLSLSKDWLIIDLS